MNLKENHTPILFVLFIFNEYQNRKILYCRGKSIGIFPDNIHLYIAIVKNRNQHVLLGCIIKRSSDICSFHLSLFANNIVSQNGNKCLLKISIKALINLFLCRRIIVFYEKHL